MIDYEKVTTSTDQNCVTLPSILYLYIIILLTIISI